jgi:peptidoglycan/LPS O-acetylase OafA/YrhL
MRRFPCFDGLRAIAALSVLTFHVVGVSHPPWLHGTMEALVGRLGQQGVAIFFVISGFLLYRPFVDAALRGTSSPSLWPFWLRRFVRIFPAYWIALTAYIYFFGFFRIRGFANFVTYYGLLQNYRGRYALLGLGVAWTLVVEVSFYVALPFINQIGRALAGAHAHLERVYRVQVGLLASLAAIGLSVRALNMWVVTTAPNGAWFPLHASGYSLLANLDWFAVGMAFALLSASSGLGRALPNVITALARRAGWCWVIAAALFVLQAQLIGTPSVTSPASALTRYVVTGLAAVTAGFLVLPAAFGDQDQSAVRRFLQVKPIVYLGGISYGIYLWHWIIVQQSTQWIANGTLPDAFLARFITVFALTVAIASASFYLIERPLIRRSHRAPAPRNITQPAE